MPRVNVSTQLASRRILRRYRLRPALTLSFKVLKLAGSETGLILVEEWEDMTAFEAYKASEGFAYVRETLNNFLVFCAIV